VKRRYTFVTVSHAIDYGLLLLQARSFRRHCPRDLVQQIIVVENFEPGHECDWRGPLLAEYGDLRSKVWFLRAREVAVMPRAHGWWSQQVLKLAVSWKVGTDLYVILDTKNHLIASLGRDFLETPDGKPRMSSHDYSSHAMLEDFERTLTYFGIDPARHVARFFPAFTPFVASTLQAHDTMLQVSSRARGPFADAFLSRGLTEFFAYGASVLASGKSLDSVYDWGQPKCPILWPSDVTPETCRAAVALADSGDLPFFGVHRGAIARLDDLSRHEIGELWCQRGLFDSRDDVMRFLRRYSEFLDRARKGAPQRFAVMLH
jgi:hypothetical protein